MAKAAWYVPAMIRQDFIQRLVAQIDLAGLVGEYVELRKSSNTLEGLCPFHAEKSPSFKVFPEAAEGAHYHCFGCGAHGGPVEFMMQRLSRGFVETIRFLSQREGMAVEYDNRDQDEHEKKRREEEGQIRQRVAGAVRKAAGEYHKRLFAPEGANAKDELERRGVGDEVILKFSLGFAPDAWDTLTSDWAFNHTTLIEAGLAVRRASSKGCYDMFRNRIMFPIFTQRGDVVAFGGRTMATGGNSGPKYLNSPETQAYSKGTELFGLYQAREAIRAQGHVIVSEGYFDVVTPAQHGIENVVSTCGTALTEQQRDVLLKIATKITFCFDGDSAGAKATRRAAELILPFVTDDHDIRLCKMPKGQDPDSLVREKGREEFLAVLSNAPTLSQYLMDELIGSGTLESPEGKTAIAVQAIKQWRRIAAPVLGTFFRQRACEKLGIAVAEFERLVAVLNWKAVHAEVELPGCPFCPGSAQLMSDGERFAVRCGTCKCRTYAKDSQAEAIKDWTGRSGAM
ncbi:DNA primase [Noviherbaspirillum album]|jgi:DNA primase|nr:DNA primase [Noviherbaspirillum sp. CPCC 100848]